MDKLNFVERIQELLKKYNIPEGKGTTHMPIGLIEFLSYVKEKRDNKSEMDYVMPETVDGTANDFNLEPEISIKRDMEGYAYVLFDDDKDNPMAIIQDGIIYDIPDFVVLVRESRLEEYVTEWLKKSHLLDFKEEAKRTDENIREELSNRLSNNRKSSRSDTIADLESVVAKLKSLETEEKKREAFIKDMEERDMRAEDVSRDTIIWLLKKFELILEEVKKQQEKAAEEEQYRMTCDIDQGDGPKRPRKYKKPVNGVEKPEFDGRFADIEKITGCKNPIIVNNGKYLVYDYDLSENGIGETGYMIFMEPESVDFNGAGTIVVRLTVEEFEEIKKELEEEQAESKHPCKVTDAMVKGEFIRPILENADEREKRTKPIRHRGGQYQKFLDRVKYYATGAKELGKHEYLRDFRAKLMETKDEGAR